MSPGANDAHPPHDIVEADLLVARVYNAIRANDGLWKSSLLIVLFDEHGGFYDSVYPKKTAVPPDHHTEEYDFTRYGVRVPALLISPYSANAFFSELLDHTSLLKYLQDKWGLGELGARTAAAASFASALQGEFRDDTPKSLETAHPGVGPAPEQRELTGHQAALVALSQHLETMGGEDANVIAARSRQVLSGAQSQMDAAVDRVEAFISHQKARAGWRPA